MAMPDANVYTEISAPDFRFAFLLCLSATFLVLLATRKANDRVRLLPSLLFMLLAFIAWMLTSGNGRYFLAMLILVGPLCVGLAYALPLTRFLRLALVIGMVLIQGIAVGLNTPWGTWAFTTWQAPPYFQISPPAELAEKPATFVGIAGISYSLMFPLFHPDSRWLRVDQVQDIVPRSKEYQHIQAMLKESVASKRNIFVFLPLPPRHVGDDLQPSAYARDEINDKIMQAHLKLQDAPCIIVPSISMARMSSRMLYGGKPSDPKRHGFWFCPLVYSEDIAATATPAPAPGNAALLANRVFAVVEKICPRFFPPGAVSAAIPGGYVRNYPDADMKLYVLDNGLTFYKYWRALNPEEIGMAQDILKSGFQMDCNTIRGRSGLPWERQL
ncbi:hypothetical protein [Ramlibacter sp. H39-3-26]|uniref:hypothetical protein n=1 Tax=Curvibacter soli TaxID=3031331 RepID=UPI0023DBA74B|nr:hypothetical protein [Ramlibacter sp. H39-3-26]